MIRLTLARLHSFHIQHQQDLGWRYWLVRVYSIAFIAGALTQIYGTSAESRTPYHGRIDEGTSLIDTFRLLQKMNHRGVVSDVPDVPRAFHSNEKGAEPARLLDEITSSFHLYGTEQDSSFIFRKRYIDPREDHCLDIEELQLTVGNIHRLVQQVSPYRVDMETITDKIRFARSLSARQLAQMKSSTLSIAELRPEQRLLWNKINLTQGYGDTELLFGRADSIFSKWSRCRVECTDSKGGKRVWFRHPGLSSSTPEARILLGEVGTNSVKYSKQSDTSRQTASGAFSRMAVPRPHVSSTLQKIIPPLNGVVTVGDIITSIRNATAVRIDAPGYVKARKIIAVIDSMSAEEILHDIEMIYGWECYQVGDGLYHLGPRRLPPPVNASDFHTKVRLALPPQLHLMRNDEAMRSWGIRQAVRLQALSRSFDDSVGPDWKSIAVTKIDGASQRRLGALVFDQLVGNLVPRYVRQVEAPSWLTAPERGSFRLAATSRGVKHPLLEFYVPRRDGKSDQWGWYVGTSSLEK